MPPRRRPKTRVESLVDALEALDKVSGVLNDIDLRTTTGELRTALRASREQANALAKSLNNAVKADVPVNPLATPAPKRAASSRTVAA